MKGKDIAATIFVGILCVTFGGLVGVGIASLREEAFKTKVEQQRLPVSQEIGHNLRRFYDSKEGNVCYITSVALSCVQGGQSVNE